MPPPQTEYASGRAALSSFLLGMSTVTIGTTDAADFRFYDRPVMVTSPKERKDLLEVEAPEDPTKRTLSTVQLGRRRVMSSRDGSYRTMEHEFLVHVYRGYAVAYDSEGFLQEAVDRMLVEIGKHYRGGAPDPTSTLASRLKHSRFPQCEYIGFVSFSGVVCHRATIVWTARGIKVQGDRTA